MFNSWRQWCRLCAKENGSHFDVFVKNENGTNLTQAIQKYFLITISPYEQSPTMICTTCYKSLTNLILFDQHTSKVEAMFAKVMFNEFNMITTDINNLKFEHGLSEIVFSFPYIQKCDQTTNTNDILNENFGNIDNVEKDVKTNISFNETITNQSKRSRKRKQNDEDQSIIEIKPLNDPKLSRSKELLQNESTDEGENFISEDLLEVKCENVDTDNDSEQSDTKPIKKRSKRIRNVKEINIEYESEEDDKKPVKIRSKKMKKVAEQFQCDKCAKIFKRESSLEQHIKKSHSTDEQQSYSCTKCEKEFQDKKRLKLHEAVHLPPELKFKHSCLYCDKKFSKSTNVQAHIRAIHIGDKSFVCEECGKAFKTNGALKEHKYVHVEDTPFECRKCPKKFKTMVFLKRHEDTHDDTFYTCPECGLKLNTKRTLQSHMVVHSDQKKYKCDYCGNEYKRAKALKNHLIIHTGLRPYTCPFCDKTFANGSNCRKHTKLSHPVELAAMEAAGEVLPQTNIPKLSQLKTVPVIRDSVSLSEHIAKNTSSNI